MNIKIRKAGPFDAAMISLIGKISFRNAFSPVFEKNNLDDYLGHIYNSEAITARIQNKNNVFFLAMADNKPVGFAEVKKNSLNEVIKSNAQLQLQKIYVLPQFHSSGVGTALMNEVIALAGEESPEYIWLHVYARNEKAIRFYERNGFKKSGRYYLGFGSQQFDFHVMAMEVSVPEFLYAVVKKMNSTQMAG